MQLIETRVALNGGSTTVEFVSEGPEFISVTFSTPNDTLDDLEAITHAKALMVQLATFGGEQEKEGSVNRYDAVSNGNFDEGSRGLEPVPVLGPARTRMFSKMNSNWDWRIAFPPVILSP
ncbi:MULTISPECIES: hypothetical protein [Rhizobium]|uniref:hypothetical protein n=1 Tax=Rhizobium TaxID=379 RepID=UPI001FED9C8F|nr:MULTISPECIES: hypothetical protein [Rhizobium]